MSDILKPFENEDDASEEDNYRGSEGWVVVAVGERGRGCYLAVDPAFGALRYHIAEGGLDDPDDAELMPDGDMGVFRATAKAWTSTSYEGEHDMGFKLTSAWVEVAWPSMEPLPLPTAEEIVNDAFAAADLVVQACGTPRPNMLRMGSPTLAEKMEPNASARACRVCAADGMTAWLGETRSVVGWSCFEHEKETAALLRAEGVLPPSPFLDEEDA